ncbi:MAG: response regulator [Lachnospiraceae bacterium]|nr:response regulator [Lachnospiraceae bacterium]
MMDIVFLGLEIFGICMIVIAILLLLQGDGSRDQKLMLCFLVGSLVQNSGYLLEITAPTLEAAMVAVKVQYLGSLTIPISYCYFIFSYSFEKAPMKILSFLKIVDAFILGLVFTCDLHKIYYREVNWLETAQGHGYLSLEYGPGYWLFMVCGTIVPYALSLYALLRVCIKKPEYTVDRKYKLILGLSVLPVVALICYSMKLTDVYDPTPFALGLVLSSVVILIWSRKVYDFSKLASRIMLNSMSDGVIALDEQKRIVSYNPAAAGIFKELNSGAIGKLVDELTDFPQGILGDDVKEEFFLNDCFYQSHVRQILDRFGKNTGYVVLILDVTETRNYIEEIKRVQKQAEQANLAKSAFLANMSHEIRTPMNAIVGLSDIIMEESRGRKVYEYACDIKASSRNLLALINDILDLSKVEAGRMELVPVEYHVKTLVNEVLNMMDVVASQRGLMMESEFDMSIPCRYLGDEGRIKQILINIMNNALKFTEKGHVKISVAGKPGETENMELLVFRVEDTGCGIREEDIEGIFENFKQVDSKRNRSVEGTGLGLSITRHLINLMGGTIGVESVYGEGTTFIVEIPQKIVDRRPLSEVPERAVKEEESLEPFSAKDCTVLVVDDNMINRKVARLRLQTYDLDIDEADSGPSAIELVRKKRYDIIFMDHMMPKMDGMEAARIIRKDCGENGRLPVMIALTANAMEGIRECFLANGFQDFITKPLEIRPMHEALLRWIPEKKRTAVKVQTEDKQSDDDKHREFQDILIEGIDTDEVAKHYSGTVEEFKELLNLYCLDGKRKPERLRELWEKGDYKGYGIEVHGLKSASANVGAMKISNSAREHEKAVYRGDETFVDSHISRLLADYEEQVEHIQDFLDKNRKTEDVKEKAQEMEQADLIEKIKDALNSLENFRAKDCAHKIVDILQYRLNPDTESRLKEIQEQLKLYEDDAAEQMLRDLIKQIEMEG